MQYQPAFLDFRPILTESQRQALDGLSSACPLSLVQGAARNYEEWMVDFVYTSAKIEGNTYDRLDTDTLLRFGVTAGGKRYSDAKMLVNLRDAFNKVMLIDQGESLTAEYIADVHEILMADLLPPSQIGVVRSSPVKIGASSYEPLSSPGRLKDELKALVSTAQRYDNPFERAIYWHNNLAYLQFFQDGNKRTARMLQTACLVQAGIMPLFFRDTLINQYQRAVIGYYETGSYESYAEFFVQNYTLVAAQMLGEEADDLLSRVACAGPSDVPLDEAIAPKQQT